MLWSLFPGMHSKLFQFLFLWHLQCTLIPLKQKVFKKYIYIFVHLLFTLKYKTVFKIKYFSCFFFKCTLEGLWKQSLELVYTVLMILICLIQQSTIGEVRSSFSFSFFFWMVVLRCSQGNIISLWVLKRTGFGGVVGLALVSFCSISLVDFC